MDKFNDIGHTLAKLRKQKHLKQSELSMMLSERGVPATYLAISKWETGRTLPNAIQFLNLCDIYGVDDVLSCFSNGQAGGTSSRKASARDEVLSGLNSDGRKMATELIKILSESSKYSQKSQLT